MKQSSQKYNLLLLYPASSSPQALLHPFVVIPEAKLRSPALAMILKGLNRPAGQEAS